MENGDLKMALMVLKEEDCGKPSGAASDASDDPNGSVHAGNEINLDEDLKAVPEQDGDFRNPAQAIMKPTAGRERAETGNVLSRVASGEFDLPADQVSSDQPRPDAAPALFPWVVLNDHGKFDADEAEALLLDLNAVQAELNENEDAWALLLLLGSAVGLPRQLDREEL